MQDRSKQNRFTHPAEICLPKTYSWQKSKPKKTKQTHDIALSQNQNVRRTMAICRPEVLSHKNESKNLRENNPATCPRTQTYEVYRIFSNLQKIYNAFETSFLLEQKTGPCHQGRTTNPNSLFCLTSYKIKMTLIITQRHHVWYWKHTK